MGYIFYAEGTSILYYDVAFDEVVNGSAERSGTVAVDRDAIVCKNKVFLPIPSGFERFFVPGDKPIRLTVLHQILGVSASPPTGST